MVPVCVCVCVGGLRWVWLPMGGRRSQDVWVLGPRVGPKSATALETHRRQCCAMLPPALCPVALATRIAPCLRLTSYLLRLACCCVVVMCTSTLLSPDPRVLSLSVSSAACSAPCSRHAPLPPSFWWMLLTPACCRVSARRRTPWSCHQRWRASGSMNPGQHNNSNRTSRTSSRRQRQQPQQQRVAVAAVAAGRGLLVVLHRTCVRALPSSGTRLSLRPGATVWGLGWWLPCRWVWLVCEGGHVCV